MIKNLKLPCLLTVYFISQKHKLQSNKLHMIISNKYYIAIQLHPTDLINNSIK